MGCPLPTINSHLIFLPTLLVANMVSGFSKGGQGGSHAVDRTKPQTSPPNASNAYRLVSPIAGTHSRLRIIERAAFFIKVVPLSTPPQKNFKPQAATLPGCLPPSFTCSAHQVAKSKEEGTGRVTAPVGHCDLCLTGEALSLSNQFLIARNKAISSTSG